MCEQCPPIICCVCGNDADTLIVAPDSDGEPEHTLYCATHAAEMMTRTAVMRATAPLN